MLDDNRYHGCIQDNQEPQLLHYHLFLRFANILINQYCLTDVGLYTDSQSNINITSNKSQHYVMKLSLNINYLSIPSLIILSPFVLMMEAANVIIK